VGISGKVKILRKTPTGWHFGWDEKTSVEKVILSAEALLEER
jgi:hypothetical protein